MPKKFESNFDPDELAKITHRGLQSLNRRDGEPRMQTGEIVMLKTAQKKEDGPLTAIFRFFQRIIDGFTSGIKALFTPPQKKVMQCQTYGHVMEQGWSGPHPRCVDCGKAILSLDEVRGATPKEDRKPKDEFQGRKYVK